MWEWIAIGVISAGLAWLWFASKSVDMKLLEWLTQTDEKMSQRLSELEERVGDLENRVGQMEEY